MPKTPTSIDFGLLAQPLPAAIERARAAFGEVDFMKPAAQYTLIQWNEDGEATPRVFANQPSGPLLPPIKENPNSFNGVHYSLYSDTAKGTVVESLLTLRSVPQGTFLVVLYNGNIASTLGPHWIIKTIDTLIPKLHVECGCFCDENDEEDMSRRQSDGESLTSIVLARVQGRDRLPAPLLAVVKSDLCDEQLLQEARDRGVAVRLTLRGNVVFSTLDL